MVPGNFYQRGGIVISNGELFVMHELRRQGLSISAIARQPGLARKVLCAKHKLTGTLGAGPFVN